jgi:non-specific serine/threonine protein kinase
MGSGAQPRYLSAHYLDAQRSKRQRSQPVFQTEASQAEASQAEAAEPQRQRGQLPAEVTGFIGRRAELARVAALLQSARLVTITGLGGVGKTRVALRAAAQAAGDYPDGICLVELSGVRDPALLTAAVASCLGLGEPDPRQPGTTVLTYLREQRILLILDTCEHLIDACATFAEAVLSQAPGVTLLATSSQPLDVSGEHTCLLPPLAVPGPAGAASGSPRVPAWHTAAGFQQAGGADAVELFAQRAAAALPGFRVTPANRADVIRLCQRLDGIPLAIELAAVRLRALPLPELTRRLDSRFQILSGGRRGAVPRHQTLRASIEWSYELCSPAEREMWARLSVFASTFNAGAAHEVCADPGVPREETVATLAGLVDKSVLLRERAEGSRYRLLDTLREFGAERLAAASSQDAVRSRLIARYSRLARHFEDHFLDDNQMEMVAELRSEQGSIQAALGYAFGGRPGQWDREGADLVIALHAYWTMTGMLTEGAYWLGKVIDRFGKSSLRRALALSIRGMIATHQGDIPAAITDIGEGIEIATERGNDLITARGYLHLNLALAFAGRHEEAEAAGAEAAWRMEAVGQRAGLAILQAQLAHLSQLSGDAERAVAQCAAGLAMLGDQSTELWIHSYLHLVAGFALFRQPGKGAECAAEVRNALRAKQSLGDVVGVAYALETLGWLAAREGRPERTAWLLGAAEPLWAHAGRRLGGTAVLEEYHQAAVRTARAALGEKRYASCAASGSRRPLSLVIGHAIADTDELMRGADAGGAEPAAEADGPGGGLTAREHEIAIHVASGLSNREIAARLFISKRTVDAHVEHIFGKLGISSRVQLTVWLRDRQAGDGTDGLRQAPMPPDADDADDAGTGSTDTGSTGTGRGGTGRGGAGSVESPTIQAHGS